MRNLNQSKYLMSSHLIIVRVLPEAATSVPNPSPAASICSAFAVKSPPAVANKLRNQWVALLVSISSWLGPGVLIRANTAAT